MVLDHLSYVEKLCLCYATHCDVYRFPDVTKYAVTVLINALPGNSSINTAQHATIEEAVFSMSAVTSQQWIVITWHVFYVELADAPG
jgi:hypothetical protein